VVLNAGHIGTTGDLAFGIAIGVGRFAYIAAGSDEITNSGTINTHGDGAAGIILVGDDHHLINSGRITAAGGAFDSEAHGLVHAAGVLVSGNGVLVENTLSGVIRSSDSASAAVELNVLERDGFPTADMASQLENFGLITAPSVAVLGGAGEETVVNHGRIVGDVDLGGGDDLFVAGTGGTLAGDLVLGAGDDQVVIEDGSGTTRIADFVAGGGDVIDVSEFFSSLGELQTQSHQQGSNVVITLDHNDRLVLEHVQLSALTAGDFLFV
jgi:hypothetical protein